MMSRRNYVHFIFIWVWGIVFSNLKGDTYV